MSDDVGRERGKYEKLGTIRWGIIILCYLLIKITIMTLIAGYDFIVFGERVNFAHAMPRIGRSHSIEHTFRTMSRDRCRTNESPSRARARFTNKLIFNFICMN